MSGARIPVLAVADAPRGTVLRAPKVGVWSGAPREGTILEPGSTAGTISQVGRKYLLVIPEGVSGRVAIEGGAQDARAVAYGEALFRVTPFETRKAGAHAAEKAGSVGKAALEIVAPTDGVFYRAAARGAKPYVDVGERIAPGRPVGLIEVMKTFNPIPYGGPGFPEEAEVVEVLAADGQEVRAGQPLVAVKKA